MIIGVLYARQSCACDRIAIAEFTGAFANPDPGRHASARLPTKAKPEITTYLATRLEQASHRPGPANKPGSGCRSSRGDAGDEQVDSLLVLLFFLAGFGQRRLVPTLLAVWMSRPSRVRKARTG